MKKRLLLIGAGPTSSLIAYNIKNCAVLSGILDVHVWEKAKGVGGRFSTSRSPTNPNSYADLGAQYLTQSQSWSQPYFDSLEKNGLLKLMDTKNIPGFKHDTEKKNYVCSKGTGAIVKNFFQQGQNDAASITTNTRVKSLTSKDLDGKRQIEVEVDTSETKESFDLVISTIPVPQFLESINFCQNISDKLRGNLASKLGSVKYTSRYALGLFYDDPIKLKEPEQIINFVYDKPPIRYWSMENSKRGIGVEHLTEHAAITVHTSVEFGEEHKDEEKDSVKDLLLNKTNEIIRSVEGYKPSFVKCHKWKYSQVKVPYSASPGYIEVLREPPLIISGDGMSYSGFEGCILSARETVNHLRALLL